MDRELVLRARGGDHAAFTAVAGAAIPRLHRTARLILRDSDRASDAVQEALVEAWLDIKSLRDPDRIEGWLYRLTVRACYREAGRTRRTRVVEIRMESLDVPGLDDSAHAVAVRDQLDRAFRRLTPEHRAVLVVHHYLGLRDQQAADALGIAVGTFKSRLNRATRALRAAFEANERAPVAALESRA
jgi:RNA polymerase sigma-70 factor (ECF subfamily)